MSVDSTPLDLATVKQMLVLEIASLSSRLTLCRKALRAFQYADDPSQSALNEENRFAGMKPILAIRAVLRELGGSAPKEELMQRLLGGGITIGKKRGEHNVRLSININVENGNLVINGDVVSLPPK